MMERIMRQQIYCLDNDNEAEITLRQTLIIVAAAHMTDAILAKA
jgi:hypothetical protein